MTATSSETAPSGHSATPSAPASPCRVRTVLNRVGDKWSIYVVDRLGQGPRRFSELHRGIDGITARMLTVTLRGLERDGILTRTVHAAVPPRVDYELTPLGRDLLQPVSALGAWAIRNQPKIARARERFDGNCQASGKKPIRHHVGRSGLVQSASST
jgi:DNA-binding HxlR family transcriptional regulator